MEDGGRVDEYIEEGNTKIPSISAIHQVIYVGDREVVQACAVSESVL